MQRPHDGPAHIDLMTVFVWFTLGLALAATPSWATQCMDAIWFVDRLELANDPGGSLSGTWLDEITMDAMAYSLDEDEAEVDLRTPVALADTGAVQEWMVFEQAVKKP